MEALIRAAHADQCVYPTKKEVQTFEIVGQQPHNVWLLWWYYCMARMQMGTIFDSRKDVICSAKHIKKQYWSEIKAIAIISGNSVFLCETPQEESDVIVLSQPNFYALMKYVEKQHRRTSRLWAILPNKPRIISEADNDPVPNKLTKQNTHFFGKELLAVLRSLDLGLVLMGVVPNRYRNEQNVAANVVQISFPSENEAAIEAAEMIAKKTHTLVQWQCKTSMKHLPEPGDEFDATHAQLLATQSFKAHGTNRTGLFFNMPADLQADADKLYRAIITEEHYAGEPVHGYQNFIETADAKGVALTDLL